MLKNPSDTLEPGGSIPPATHSTGNVLSSAIDTLGFSDALLVVEIGAMATSATLDVQISECDTSGGTYADVTGAAITQAVDATDDNTTKLGAVRLLGRKRYLKIDADVATDTVDFGASLLLANPANSKLDITAGSFDFDV